MDSNQSLDDFIKKYQGLSSAEDRIHLAIQFMRSSLSQEGSPHFKEFWEARNLCLPLFRESLNSIARAQLWADFIELSNEATRLKEILSEQSSFAVEQIDLAIKAFEQDLQNYDRLLKDIPPLLLPENSKTLAEKWESYAVLQRELNLLNALAGRINSLRKELLKTDMRIRDKNNFFKSLSETGDRIFPRRKELIKKISEDFLADVDSFIKAYFQQELVAGAPLYVLREEIKALQGIAKTLTLNTHSFTQSRLMLSECWDKVKVLEKERKKEIASKKQLQIQNKISLEERVKIFSEKSAELSFADKKREIDELFQLLRSSDLRKEDFAPMRKSFEELRSSSLVREAAPKQVVREISEPPSAGAPSIKEKMVQLLETQEISYDQLQQEYASIAYELQKSLPIEHALDIEHLFVKLQDSLVGNSEKAYEGKSDKAGEKVEHLLTLHKEFRQQIKSRIESCRKTMGGSGFNFEKAMIYRELSSRDKKRLDHLNESIADLEEKLAELEA